MPVDEADFVFSGLESESELVHHDPVNGDLTVYSFTCCMFGCTLHIVLVQCNHVTDHKY